MIELRTAQKLFLEKAEESRKNGNKKGVLIFATGLGKTLASLSDALKIAGKKGKILVLVHNHNLLYQLAKDFKLLNKKKKIGFLYKSKKEVNAEVLFANIMTLKKEKYLRSFKPNEFDYIIIDETHHVGAKSYKKVLDYFKSKFLLGMTATPNRTDQIDILPLYDNNVIMNVDSFEAINKGWLRPYKNIFLWDPWCDYNKLKSYRLKSGYFKYFNKDLGRAYFVPERDKAIVKWFKEKAKDRKGIGFCVGVNESIRMAKLFNDNGIKSIAIFGDSKKGRNMNEKKRNKILEDYEKGKYQMIFNCEIIGEGLHLSFVDVILKLRPTMSAIKDNQHNGRGLFNIEGLKKNGNKYEQLLIMDLVGNYKNAYLNYIYQGKPRKNKGGKKLDIRKIIELPIGCEVEFEERVVEEFNRQLKGTSGRSLKDAIEEYKKIYGDKKPFRRDLEKENLWIYSHFKRHKLLDKYCLKSRLKTLKDAIEEYKKIYGTNKPSRQRLEKENSWIHYHFKIHKLMDKYCVDCQRHLKNAIEEYKKIYGDKKPFRRDLEKENLWIHSHFRKHKLVNKYCLKSRLKTLKDAIEEYKKIYGTNKPSRQRLEKENSWIHSHFRKHKLVNKYCVDCQRRLKDAIKEYKKIYGDKKPFRRDLEKENLWIYGHFKRHKLLDKYCLKSRLKTLKDAIEEYKKIYGTNKPSRQRLKKENSWIHYHFRKHKLVNKYCLPRFSKKKTSNNITITSKYKSKTKIPKKVMVRFLKAKLGNYDGMKKRSFGTTKGKEDIRLKIIKYMKDGDVVLLLESPELAAIKEIEKQKKKPSKIIIPNDKEFKEVAEALRKYKTNLKIELINTSALQYLHNSNEKFDFVWLDYCGAFSYYVEDLNILFKKHFNDMKLILTYNLFDPAKEGDSNYFVRVISYVLRKVKRKGEFELIEDISKRYKKNMYNIGFDIKQNK